MKLMTKEILRKLPSLGSSEADPNAPAVVKFFTPWTGWTWYVIEGAPQPDGDVIFFGLVDGLEEELGAFTLKELEAVRGPGGLKIERDLYWTPKPWRECRRKGAGCQT